MIEYTLDKENSVLFVRPRSSLEKSDFIELARVVDPFIEQSGDLKSLLVNAPSFPGWDSLGSMAEHFRFVRDHQKRIGKVALVTDSAIGNVAELLASHFVSARLRHFSAAQLDEAKSWVLANG